MHDIEVNALGQPDRLESGVQFMRRVDGNLRILNSVQNEEGRILPIDVKYRRSGPREIGLVSHSGVCEIAHDLPRERKRQDNQRADSEEARDQGRGEWRSQEAMGPSILKACSNTLAQSSLRPSNPPVIRS